MQPPYVTCCVELAGMHAVFANASVAKPEYMSVGGSVKDRIAKVGFYFSINLAPNRYLPSQRRRRDSGPWPSKRARGRHCD